MNPGQILAGTQAVALASKLTQHLSPASTNSKETFKSLLQKQSQSAGTSSAKSVPAGDKTVQVTVAEQQTKLLTQFASQLHQLLTDQGISTEQPIVLEFDSFGDLRISGSHPQARDIETTLFMNPQLAELAESLVAESQKQLNQTAGLQARLVVAGNQARVVFVESDVT